MLNLFKKVFSFFNKISKDKSTQGDYGPDYETDVPQRIADAEKLAKKIFGKSVDLIIHNFNTSHNKAMIVFVDGLVNQNLLDRDVIRPLVENDWNGDLKTALNVIQYKTVDNMPTVVGEILDGNAAIFYDGLGKVIIIESKQWDKRSVETPDTEAVIRGPREGFIENIRTNTSLLRRKIKTPKLIMENLVLGRQTNTKVVLAYIEGIVNVDVLKELRSRLSKIDTDAILESGYIEQYIEDAPYSVFSTVALTQKPDIVAGKILEGRVAIFCDGTPHVMTVPHIFIENIQTSEDYYLRMYVATILRVIRVISLFATVLLPGFYISLITFHQEMIPTIFLMTLYATQENVPIPSGGEAFFMAIMFELLRESGTRLPRPIGSAISIVGALIIGDAAVNAGLVGAPMVIIIAVTAVTSFIVPTLTEATTLLRFIFLFLGGFMGLIGIVSGLVIIIAYTASLRSFGIPYLSAIAPLNPQGLKDFIPRFPLWMMTKRPESIAKDNVVRQGNSNWRKP